ERGRLGTKRRQMLPADSNGKRPLAPAGRREEAVVERRVVHAAGVVDERCTREGPLCVQVENARLKVHIEVADLPVRLDIVALRSDASLVDVLSAVLAIRSEVSGGHRDTADVFSADARADRIAGGELRARVSARSGADQRVVPSVE